MARSHRGDVALAAAAYAAFAALAHLAGFAMRIPWDFFQLLDGPTLGAHPLGSLCLLHSQPPGLNALLALVLQVAAALVVRVESVAAACFAGLGLLETIVLAGTVRALTGSRLVAALAVVVMLADPGYALYGNLFFYEFLDHVLVVLLLGATVAYLAHGRRRALVGVAASLGALAATRTLFHPLWAATYCGLVVVLRGWVAPGERRRLANAALAAAILVPALVAWPLKNLLVYDRFVTASMTGYSVSRAVPGCQNLALQIYVGTGTAPATSLERAARATAVCGSAAEAVVTGSTKAGGARNWNHAIFLESAPELARCATAWRLGHPVEWLARAAGQYAMWTRPTFVHPYGGQIVGPLGGEWVRYATAYERVLFPDLRPAVEWLVPGFFLHREAMLRGRPIPYTLFGFVVLPAILGLAAWQLARRRPSLRTATLAAALLCLLWPMAGACLTDGQEGNRMRFSTAPALLVVELCLAAELLGRDGR